MKLDAIRTALFAPRMLKIDRRVMWIFTCSRGVWIKARAWPWSSPDMPAAAFSATAIPGFRQRARCGWINAPTLSCC